ncbi:hypothetical protein [Staphylococcus delphini]|uniref:Uncharacterized protein n=1 Tax=Staphylococcus delphini TaxID=53344 RepID=A0AAQ0D586_9STAP|nr:hypothetical protein [Staphylococcus delphini]QUM66042.1 hypothetical protein IPU21_07795 [Staphylococcus delphini]QUM68476.1 hypothetical protein IPU22_07745 [Staphylococcus delphini]
MKNTYNWIIWIILISSFLGIVNNGASVIAFAFSIVILTKHQLIEKDKKVISHINNTSRKEKKSTNNQIQLENDKLSIKLFGVPDIDKRVTNSQESAYYSKIKNESEQVISAVSCYAGKKFHYKGSTNFYVKEDLNTHGILILTTENLYFISLSSGFLKEIYPINKINGMKKCKKYDLEITYGRSKKYFVLTGFQDPSPFVKKYIDLTM